MARFLLCVLFWFFCAQIGKGTLIKDSPFLQEQRYLAGWPQLALETFIDATTPGNPSSPYVWVLGQWVSQQKVNLGQIDSQGKLRVVLEGIPLTSTSGVRMVAFSDWVVIFDSDGVITIRCKSGGTSCAISGTKTKYPIGTVNSVCLGPYNSTSFSVFLASATLGVLQWESSSGVLSHISLAVINGNYLANQTVTSVAYSAPPLDELAIATPLVLYRRRPDSNNESQFLWRWNFVSNHIDLTPNAMYYDFENRLWIGDNQTVNWRSKEGHFFRLGGFEQSPGGVIGGLPYGNITEITGVNGLVALATRRGIITYIPKEKKPWQYYASNRHLVNDTIYRICIDSNEVIYAFHPTGLTLLWYESWTLAQKATHYQGMVEPRHDRYGLVAGVYLKQYGDLSTYIKVADETDGLWSGIYLASQCFRFATTKAEEARQSGWKTLNGMALLEKKDLGTIDAAGTHKGEKAWHNSTTMPEFVWMSGTSSDDVTGHLFAYGIAYHLAQTPEEKKMIGGIIDRVVGYIVANHYYYIDITGQPTRWGVWAPEKLNQDFDWADQRGPNSIEISSYLAAAYNVTGLSLYKDQLLKLLLSPEIDYADNIRNTRVTAAWNVNYSDDELSLLSHFLLLFSNRWSPSISEISRDSLAHYWRQIRLEGLPFFTFLCSLGGGDVSENELERAVHTLRSWPLELIDWPIDNQPRQDYRANPDAALDVRVKFGSVDVLPSNIRPLQRYNACPFGLSGGGGYTEQDPGTWLLGYWMAKYYKFL